MTDLTARVLFAGMAACAFYLAFFLVRVRVHSPGGPGSGPRVDIAVSTLTMVGVGAAVIAVAGPVAVESWVRTVFLGMYG